MLVKVIGGSVQGIHAVRVTVEVNVCTGVKYYIVGLPDTVIRESFQRIEAALKNNGLRMPRQKIVINLAPADLKKEGSAYDLPIAAGILAASDQLDASKLNEYMIMGELSLDGYLQPIKGILPLTISARQEGLKGIIIPAGNVVEALMVDGISVIGLNSIGDLLKFFNEGRLPVAQIKTVSPVTDSIQEAAVDFADVKGQQDVKRAMEVAAAGGHNILLIGPPGSGKTMLACRLPGILPELTPEESLDTTRIHSVAGMLKNTAGLINTRPFRSPHHTISDIALAGGGVEQRPGEISLAHHGILFLDELPEFKRSALEVLRQPIEERLITISRARYTVTFPASFMLVASMNPCPCGYSTHPNRECSCTVSAIRHYMSKISGPLLDRIDLHIQVSPVSFSELNSKEKSESSEKIRIRVTRAREIQQQRQGRTNNFINAAMNTALIKKHCMLDISSLTMLEAAMKKLSLSARAYNRILKVARTIADLEGSSTIQVNHIGEAIQYRSLDRVNWCGS